VLLNTDPDAVQGFVHDKIIIKFTTGLFSSTPYKGRSGSANMIFFHFSFFWGQFWPAWNRIRIPNLEPDPLTRLNPSI
jgi:hypothetical protein